MKIEQYGLNVSELLDIRDGVCYGFRPEANDILRKYPDASICVNIPEGVTEIAPGAFCVLSPYEEYEDATHYPKQPGCILLSHVTLPSTLTTVGECAFSGCIDLTISGGNNIISIGKAAFAYCEVNNFAPDIDLHATTVIENDAFLESGYVGGDVILANNVSIGNGAFLHCKGHMDSLTIPSTATLGNYAFTNEMHVGTLYLPHEIHANFGNRRWSIPTGSCDAIIYDGTRAEFGQVCDRLGDNYYAAPVQCTDGKYGTVTRADADIVINGNVEEAMRIASYIVGTRHEDDALQLISARSEAEFHDLYKKPFHGYTESFLQLYYASKSALTTLLNSTVFYALRDNDPTLLKDLCTIICKEHDDIFYSYHSQQDDFQKGVYLLNDVAKEWLAKIEDGTWRDGQEIPSPDAKFECEYHFSFDTDERGDDAPGDGEVGDDD